MNDQHLWVFLKGREQLVRIHTSSGEVEVMNTWSKEVALEDCRGLARIGARLYCAETFELRSYDMGTGAFTEVYPPDVSTVLRDVTTDGQQLYLSMLHQTSSSVKQRIVRVDPKTGKASTLLDTDALSGAVRMVWVDKALYITTRERLVRFDLASKKLTTVAGVAGKPGCKDGVGAQARLRYPAGIASDGAGGLYIGDRDCHTLSHLDLASGKLVTVAGSPKNATFCPGQGAAAGINNPSQLVYEQKSGTLLVVDGYEGLVLRVTRRPPSGDAGVGALEAGSLDAAPAQ